MVANKFKDSNPAQPNEEMQHAAPLSKTSTDCEGGKDTKSCIEYKCGVKAKGVKHFQINGPIYDKVMVESSSPFWEHPSPMG
jgi:hypothetical protein